MTVAITRADGGALLVGSVPLSNGEEVFRSVAAALGDRIERMPDGETGPRSDWIVWQYPVLSSRPEFEVCPPAEHQYRSLPRLRLRDDADVATLVFDELGYAQAAIGSYRTFARLKRDAVIPAHVRFQVCLPTPIAPMVAFVSPEHQAVVEPIYEASLLNEIRRILEAIPHDQLAVQWDANFEFAIIDGLVEGWFADARAGVVERLLRLAQSIPASVPLGFHFCQDHERLHLEHPYDPRRMVDVANALAGAMGRPLNWLHLPVRGDRLDVAELEKLAPLRLQPETQLYLGLVHPHEPAASVSARITAAQRYLPHFGVATACGWGRFRGQDVDGLLGLHASSTVPTHEPQPTHDTFTWPKGFIRVPDDDWTHVPVDDFGTAYDNVEQHGWYRNLDPTVDELRLTLGDGDVLLDYSGGTGILLDRLKYRLSGTAIGTIIVDSSPKFLRVALEKFGNDPNVALRVLRYRKAEGRLDRLEEVLGPEMLQRGVDVVSTTNAIHLYPDLADTAASWMKVLRPGGRLMINSGNIRNPRARRSEWILDETVWVVAELAEGIVRSHPEYGEYRPLLDDVDRMKRHAANRDRVFLAPRPLDFYIDTLGDAGFEIDSVREASIEAGVEDWYEFLSAYHDAVLGWVGRTEKIDGYPPTTDELGDRLRLLRQAMDLLFGNRPTFQACWTYITALSPAV